MSQKRKSGTKRRRSPLTTDTKVTDKEDTTVVTTGISSVNNNTKTKIKTKSKTTTQTKSKSKSKTKTQTKSKTKTPTKSKSKKKTDKATTKLNKTPKKSENESKTGLPEWAVSPDKKRQRMSNLTFEEKRDLLLRGKILEQQNKKKHKNNNDSNEKQFSALFDTMNEFFIENNCIIGLDHRYGLSKIMSQLNKQSEYYANDENLLSCEPCYVVLFNISPVVEHCDVIEWVIKQTEMKLSNIIGDDKNQYEFALLVKQRVLIDKKYSQIYESRMNLVKDKLKRKSNKNSKHSVDDISRVIKECLRERKRNEYLRLLPKIYFDIIKSGDLSLFEKKECKDKKKSKHKSTQDTDNNKNNNTNTSLNIEETLGEVNIDDMNSKEKEILGIKVNEKVGNNVQGSVYPNQLTYFSSLTGRAWLRFDNKHEALHCVLNCNGIKFEDRVIAAGLGIYKRKHIDVQETLVNYNKARVRCHPKQLPKRFMKYKQMKGMRKQQEKSKILVKKLRNRKLKEERLNKKMSEMNLGRMDARRKHNIVERTMKRLKRQRKFKKKGGYSSIKKKRTKIMFASATRQKS